MASATFRGRRSIDWTRSAAAVARGWRLSIAKPSLLGAIAGGVATIFPDPESEVWGVVYEISEEDLEHLEMTEGVRIGHYERSEIFVEPVHTWNARHRAVTLTSGRPDSGLLPSTRYMNLLVEGAAEHGLPAPWIAMLRSIPASEESADAALVRQALDQAMRKPRAGE
jgi:gamma-glutamylcyclotransferase (GGCT)/AIG2-like uncharacterized protein YtfP